jgi:N-acetylglucosamine malate deacetylase 2
MRLLAIFAHPDDESYGPAGTLAKYAAEGHTVGLVTLTRGEAGSLGISKELGPVVLAERRVEELKCAAKILNISYLQIHQLPDKKLAELPDETGTEIIENEIRKFAPDAVITFHKDGISGHPDHKTVSRWVLNTIDRMNPTPFLFWFGITIKQAGHTSTRELFPMESDKITHKIDVQNVLEKKIEAIHCHQTQDELWQSMQKIRNGYKSSARWEHFMQIRPLPTNHGIRSELF